MHLERPCKLCVLTYDYLTQKKLNTNLSWERSVQVQEGRASLWRAPPRVHVQIGSRLAAHELAAGYDCVSLPSPRLGDDFAVAAGQLHHFASPFGMTVSSRVPVLPLLVDMVRLSNIFFCFSPCCRSQFLRGCGGVSTGVDVDSIPVENTPLVKPRLKISNIKLGKKAGY